MIHSLIYHILVVLGIDDTTGPWYAFWSGFGSDLSEFAIIGIVYHKLNCHEAGCWRIGRHHQADLQVMCSKHFNGGKHA